MDTKDFTTKDVLGKVVLLRPDFLQSVYKEDIKAAKKEARPFLIIEAMYSGQPQLFAIPLQTSIKNSLPNFCWDKLPARLETEPGRSRGMLYSLMVPITPKCVLRLKDAEGQISEQDELRSKIFDSLLIKREDFLPEKARPSYKFLKEQVRKYGMSFLGNQAAHTAYSTITKAVLYETYKVINEGLSLNEFNERPIVKKAENYLNNHYLKTINKKTGATREFVDMPLKYTNIEALMIALQQYDENFNITQAQPTAAAQGAAAPATKAQPAGTFAPAKEPQPPKKIESLNFQDTEPLRCYPFPSGKYEEGERVLVKLPPLDSKAPVTQKQPVKLPSNHVRLKENSDGVFIVAATTKLITQVAALNKNLHIPVIQKK